jgi:hypothetical protein
MLVLLAMAAATAGSVTYINTPRDEYRDINEEASDLHIMNINVVL